MPPGRAQQAWIEPEQVRRKPSSSHPTKGPPSTRSSTKGASDTEDGTINIMADHAAPAEIYGM